MGQRVSLKLFRDLFLDNEIYMRCFQPHRLSHSFMFPRCCNFTIFFLISPRIEARGVPVKASTALPSRGWNWVAELDPGRTEWGQGEQGWDIGNLLKLPLTSPMPPEAGNWEGNKGLKPYPSPLFAPGWSIRDVTITGHLFPRFSLANFLQLLQTKTSLKQIWQPYWLKSDQ